jgi:hypothetical protein
MVDIARTAGDVLTEQIEVSTGSAEVVHDLTAECERFLAAMVPAISGSSR